MNEAGQKVEKPLSQSERKANGGNDEEGSSQERVREDKERGVKTRIKLNDKRWG